MGSQQLLLIIVGVMVIGIMIAVGIVFFRDHASATNRDAIANDLVHAASNAQLYKRRPKSQGGGGGSFVGFQLETVFRTLSTLNGTFSLANTPTDSKVVMEGIGKEVGHDTVAPVKLSIRVLSERIEVVEVN